ncbi:hypothetical protein ACFX13_014918 [Malus domestica]|uniref:Uncharacterized protein n=1 Tax=Malus domestica TaxID=3750 RepID=A0A498I452_MALDO|nr:protein LURP-one-related 4-like [Malus domestica]XP_050123023.1 protein LURP-one-related 4-like [Malus sylvestris]RXH76982.1 hypothetical protein DVH24_019870 [Malus domestica]
MANVCPPAPQVLSLSRYTNSSSKRDTYTIWMKSLVCHTNGCTVYNSSGNIVYRVDNYDKKCSNEVHLMDLQGKVLYTICKKKLKAFEQWDGYRTSSPSNRNKEKPGFQVKSYSRMLMGTTACQITVECDKYWIVAGKSGAVGYRIVDIDEHIVAEAKQKLSSSGVVLGDDVLTLEVVPHMDHSFIMAIVIVYGLICRKM